MSFSPKKSTRLSPNISLPLKLTNLSLNVVTKMLSETADNRSMIKNSRKRKAIRDYFSRNLPALLRQDILKIALEMRGAQSVLNLLDLFEPRQDAKDSVDLVGPLSLRFGCSRAGRHKWFIRPLEQRNLTLSQLEQLYNILIWSNPAEIRMLALSVSSDVLKASKIPNILARGRALTKVTLLGGADNHTLRILGINCPRLKYLDISNSTNVTDQGLLNLLLSRPPRRKEKILRYYHGILFAVVVPIAAPQNYGDLSSRKKNPCADTIAVIKLPCTSITPHGLRYGCELLGNSYLFLPLPFRMIVRIMESDGIWMNGIPYNPAHRLFTHWHGLGIEVTVSVTLLVRHLLEDRFEPMPPTVMDYILLPEVRPIKGRLNSILFIRLSGYRVSEIHMKADSENVTSLVLNCIHDVSLNILGVLCPFLKSFRGWISGFEYVGDEPFLPNLEVMSAWCHTSIPLLSILRLAPSIKLCELQTVISDTGFPDRLKLTDSTLEECLQMNRSLAESLEEIIFSPTRLTVASLRTLLSSCPNLKIIGDLQSWKINSRQIKSFNNHLNKVNSKCVLSMMNFPPPRIQNFKWI